MKNISIQIGRFLIFLKRIEGYFVKRYQRSRFKSIGKNVVIGQNCTFTEYLISIGDNVSIGKNCCFQSTNGEIIIGS